MVSIDYKTTVIYIEKIKIFEGLNPKNIKEELYGIYGEHYLLGTYKTKERALKIMKKIQKKYESTEFCHYKMPSN